MAGTQQAELAEHPGGAERRLGRGDERDVGADDVADHSAEERIVRASEQEGIDVRGRDGREETFGEHRDLVAGGLTALDSSTAGTAALVRVTWRPATIAACSTAWR